MLHRLLVANSLLLLTFIAMYLGTGWSLILFSFPVAPRLTVDSYALVFVEPVDRATRTFTTMTKLMIVSALIMIVGEWRHGGAWAPAVVLALVVASTVLTVKWIFPHNERMRRGITDPEVLRDTLRRWMALNRIRVAMWTAQWLTMMVYFALEIG